MKQNVIRSTAVAMAVAIQAQFASAGYPDFDYETANIADAWGGVNDAEEGAIRSFGNYATYLTVYSNAYNDWYHTVNPVDHGNTLWLTVNLAGGWTWSVNIGGSISLESGPGVSLNGGITEGQAGSMQYNFSWSGDNHEGTVQYNVYGFFNTYVVSNAYTSGNAIHGQATSSFSAFLEEVDVWVEDYC